MAAATACVFRAQPSSQDDMTFTGEQAQKIWAAMGT